MARQWYIFRDNKKYGPYSEEHMRSFIGEGRLKGSSLVWCPGMSGWARVADVEPFRSYFARPEAVAGPPPLIPSAGRGVGRTAVAAILVIVVIVSLLGVWWIYLKPTQTTQPQSSTRPTVKELGLEAEGAVDFVVDGDTIRISQVQTNQDIDNEIGPTEYVRFARIQAPEEGESGYTESKNFVTQLIADGGNFVYLDLDNLAVSKTGRPFRDRSDYERLTAVVYVYVNNKLVNVNAETLIWGQANYPGNDWLKYISITSEFNHNDWLDPNYPYVR
jgi:endonuclease YncB( thermonuclease family)